jgi:hypothetical protein
MRTSVKITGCLALLTIGYVLGASQLLSPQALLAQGDKKYGSGKGKSGADAAAAQGLSDETKAKIKAAADALRTAMEALQAEQRYDSAIKSVNAFSVLSGGGNSVKDLQAGLGVDPETFAALYAGLATDSIVVDIGRDIDGKMTYKGKVVRMYPISAIQAAYVRRADITGEEIIPPRDETVGKSKPAKKKPEAEEETEE